MTVEQKAKAYDEALERVWELLSRCKNNRDRRTMVYRVEDIKSIFPELKKSEDEKIKEDLIQWISDFPDMIWSGHYREDVITWLERQDKKETENKFELKFNVGDEIKTGNKESLTITKIDEKGYWSEDLFICSFEDSAKWELVGKPVDMIKPKFKVGDWISNDMCDVHIASIEDGMYYFDEGDGLSIVFVDEHYHIWTIEDAIDGDVLVNGSNIFIFHFINGTRLMGYCHVNTDNGRFYDDIGKNECFCLIDAVINPATKEQRDLLFQKMKEAEYIFDFKNKELKKIKNDIEIPFGAKDSELQEATYYIPDGFHAEIDGDFVVIKKGEKLTAWSEDDERIKKRLINLVNEVYDNTNYITFLEHKELLAWLEKLDDNVEL